MDRDDILDLLTIIAASDHRTVGESDVQVWQRAIGHLDPGDCVDAIEAFRREQPGVWLEPGHVIARVRAKVRDRISRMSVEDRPVPPAAKRVRPDDDDYPAEWTPEQRLAASWGKLRAGSEDRERRQALSDPRTLTSQRRASDETRAQVLAQFGEQFGFDDGEGGLVEAPGVEPLSVKCPYCRAKAGAQCATPARGMPCHPSRLEAAALAAGLDEDAAAEIVGVACRRQVVAVTSTWTKRDYALLGPESAEAAEA